MIQAVHIVDHIMNVMKINAVKNHDNRIQIDIHLELFYNLINEHRTSTIDMYPIVMIFYIIKVINVLNHQNGQKNEAQNT